MTPASGNDVQFRRCLYESQLSSRLARRSFLSLAAAVPAALAQTQQRDWTNQQPARYPDPDVVALDKSFAQIQTVQRRHLAALHRDRVGRGSGLERRRDGTWCGATFPNNRQMRLTEEDGHVSVFRSPSGYSNGNTFDFEGRQLSCEHADRRVVRYEHDGTRHRDRR